MALVANPSATSVWRDPNVMSTSSVTSLNSSGIPPHHQASYQHHLQQLQQQQQHLQHVQVTIGCLSVSAETFSDNPRFEDTKKFVIMCTTDDNVSDKY
jgi:hypothetical protein